MKELWYRIQTKTVDPPIDDKLLYESSVIFYQNDCLPHPFALVCHAKSREESEMEIQKLVEE